MYWSNEAAGEPFLPPNPPISGVVNYAFGLSPCEQLGMKETIDGKAVLDTKAYKGITRYSNA